MACPGCRCACVAAGPTRGRCCGCGGRSLCSGPTLLLFVLCLLSVTVPLLRLPDPERRVLLILGLTLVVGLLPLTWEVRKVTWFVMVLMTTMGTVVISPAADRVQVARA